MTIEYFTPDEASALLDELAPEMRQPGDIDVYQAMIRWQMSREGARKRMEDFILKGRLVKKDVYDPKKCKRIIVYRENKKPPEGG